MECGDGKETVLPDCHEVKETFTTRGAGVTDYRSLEAYREMHQDSVKNFEQFWAARADELVSWSKKWQSVVRYDFHKAEVAWFVGGKLNVCYNCLDRHLTDGRRNKAAIIWQGERDEEVRVFTYQMLHSEVCRLAGVLRGKGVKQGDCVAIYLPMIPELVISMLACARIGAIHSVVFSGFSATSLKNRMHDCGSKVLITADGVIRGGRTIPLKPNADEALEECSFTKNCIVVRRTGRDVSMLDGRDSWWHDEVGAASLEAGLQPTEMAAEDNLFILYTSGSTGKPKGVMHSCGGYLTYAMHTCQMVFDLKDDDLFWCTADIGWITGHSYAVYGPLGLGGTVLMYEGIPVYPSADRFWQIIEKFRVTLFYTAPTAIRALMGFGSEPTERHDISSLRILGSVGEPINPEVWQWYHANVGKKKLPLVDTWWQTETGGVMIAPLPHVAPMKPGSAAMPLPGIDVAILNEDGQDAGPDKIGRLVVKRPWPGMLTGIFGDRDCLKNNYFSVYPGVYDTGDSAYRDKDGYFWITGRLDDVINVSGHRLGSAEIEAAMVSHRSVLEAAVVGVSDVEKGQTVYAYVTVLRNVEQTPELLQELRLHVRAEIGSIATPSVIQYATGLPKTRSGKVMRRVLKKIAANEFDSLGDISTMADSSVVDDLIEGKKRCADQLC